MNKRLVSVLVSTAVAVLILAGAASGQEAPSAGPPAGTEPPPPSDFVPGEIVVKDDQGYEVEEVAAQNLGAVQEAARDLEATDPTVEAAGPNYVYEPEFVPDDPYFRSSQYWLKGGTSGIRANLAWDQSRGGNVPVGVVDSGWRRGHPDLEANVAAERDFLAASPDGTANDNWWHGTSVAGIIGADTNNDKGVSSVAFNAAALNVAKACTREACTTANTAPAIDWLTRVRDVKIVNLSFGAYFATGELQDPVLAQEIRDAQARGALIVASNGNNGEVSDNHFPSCYADVVGVGSIDEDGTVSDFSTRGPCVDLVAPGRALTTTFNQAEPPNTPYANVTGTSFAAPQAAGTAVLIKAKSPNLGADQIAQRMFKSAIDRGPAGRDDSFGHGLINANCAVSPNEPVC